MARRAGRLADRARAGLRDRIVMAGQRDGRWHRRPWSQAEQLRVGRSALQAPGERRAPTRRGRPARRPTPGRATTSPKASRKPPWCARQQVQLQRMQRTAGRSTCPCFDRLVFGEQRGEAAARVEVEAALAQRVDYLRLVGRLTDSSGRSSSRPGTAISSGSSIASPRPERGFGQDHRSACPRLGVISRRRRLPALQGMGRAAGGEGSDLHQGARSPRSPRSSASHWRRTIATAATSATAPPSAGRSSCSPAASA